MKSIHKQRGFWNFALPALASFAGGILQNESNESMAEGTTQFNAAQAALNRQFNADEAEKSRSFSAEQASRSMGFSERMSNSAYQRTIKDMKSAGLNPMLAYSQGGASTPSGAVGASAQAQGSAATGATATAKDIITPAIASAQQFKATEAQIANTQANTDLINAQRDKTSQEVINLGTSQSQTIAETERTKAATAQIAEQTSLTRAQVDQTIQAVKESYAREDLAKAETVLKKLSVAEAKAFEQYYESLGQASPFIKFVLSILNMMTRR